MKTQAELILEMSIMLKNMADRQQEKERRPVTTKQIDLEIQKFKARRTKTRLNLHK